jgi:large subunit ribosomal protein L1
MVALSKRKQKWAQWVKPNHIYSPLEGFALVKKCAEDTKFAKGESVDVAISLGIDARKSEQSVRSSTVLPNGTGKEMRVAVFAQGDKADQAKAAGADLVGFEDLADAIQAGEMNFDVVIASPDAMRVVGRLGQVLGPRGLMPNPKVGTVTADIATAVKNAKAGQVRYRAEKGGIVHCIIGKSSFTEEQLFDNLKAVIADLKKVKPAGAKGIYLKKITVSSTMGPGIVLDRKELDS